ncbi:MAG: hypothetical protein QXH08_06695 [Candidatus Hadarchaeales archaeon]
MDEKTCGTREIIFQKRETKEPRIGEDHKDQRVEECGKPDPGLLVKLRLKSLEAIDFPIEEVRGE